MDNFYNKEQAAKVLDEVIANQMHTSSSPQMYSMDMDVVAKFGLSIGKETDVASKLIQQNEDTGETEEATIAFQGIIPACFLPPFDGKYRHSDNRYHYTPNAKLLPVPEFIMKDNRLSDDSSKNTTITESNQVFTPIKQAVSFATVAISTKLDPCGTLAKVDNTKWVHTEDNEVQTYNSHHLSGNLQLRLNITIGSHDSKDVSGWLATDLYDAATTMIETLKPLWCKDRIKQAADEDVGQEASKDAAMENVA
ncbi:hypothetical protein BDN71DRAFT_1429663 [Pleurotus eryngii]|uniref:Uncharacterized protein n=1 Tax=Pleurotus eryngii TaxID=5323 RepID=A0A9P5ZZB0_PLEER|nr:hypothetical protein BDN71DRAFT_1429663 [Pleurotus eryngii]